MQPLEGVKYHPSTQYYVTKALLGMLEDEKKLIIQNEQISVTSNGSHYTISYYYYYRQNNYGMLCFVQTFSIDAERNKYFIHIHLHEINMLKTEIAQLKEYVSVIKDDHAELKALIGSFKELESNSK